MKKRILALVCAMTLVLGMSLTVCAAGSSNAGSAANNAANNETSNTTQSDDKISVDNSTGQVLTSATIEEFAKTTTISSGVEGAKLAAVPADTAKAMITEANKIAGTNTFVASIVDLQVPAGTGKATFTLACPNVWKGQKVSILHLKADGTYEVIAPNKVENNAVTFTMTSYSPIAIVIDTASPKTADTGLAAGMLIAIMAMIGAVGAVGCAVIYRKKAIA